MCGIAMMMENFQEISDEIKEIQVKWDDEKYLNEEMKRCFSLPENIICQINCSLLNCQQKSSLFKCKQFSVNHKMQP